MKQGKGKRLLWTGVVTPLIMLAVYALRNTAIGSLFFPLYMPWFLLMAFAFPNGGSVAGLPKFVWAGLAINFVIVWIALLVAALVVRGVFSLFRKKKA
jgi:hypothetical protein